MQSLTQKIKDQKAVIGVIGIGRVGLPLASVFASKGLKVIGIDIDENKLNSIKNSKCPFYDPELQKILDMPETKKNLLVSNNLKEYENQIDIIFVTVGTPINVNNSFDYSQLYKSLNEICRINLEGKLVIMRSTLPPSTTELIVKPFLEDKSNKKAGIDFALAVCPERILEGQAVKELQELPEIIGGVNVESNNLVKELFLLLNSNKQFSFTSPTGAELAKLFTNIYRYISFALSNEFAIWAEKYGVDAPELIKIANFGYERSNIPKPGFVGGPCLSKDGALLDNNTTFSSIISTAWKLNESIPQHIVNNLMKIEGNLYNKNVTVLGLSFKAGSDDLRDSPSVKLVEVLKGYGAKVSIFDPHVKETASISEALKSPDIIILATNHKEFKDIVDEIRKSSCKIIYDVWSMFKPKDFPNQRYFRLGKGFI